MTFPKYATIEGKKYPIDTSFKTALKCFDVIENPDIGNEERTLAIVYMLFGFIPEENIDKFIEACTVYLRCGDKSQKGGKKDMDFKADEAYIYASFMSDYHIDLANTDMHYYQFVNLLRGLTEDCILSRVREIRNYDLSTIKDAKLRDKIADAKNALAMPVRRSREEQEAIDRFESLFEE